MSEGQARDSHGRWASTGSVGNQPVTASAGQASVHTRLRPAARDRIIRNKMVDQSHFKVRTDAEVTALTDHGKAGPSPGRFQYMNGKIR
jgi:hypothetical protein